MTTVEAGKILGLSSSGVKDLMRRGLLHDTSKKKGRHVFKLTATEVREFARTYKRRSHSNVPVFNVKSISTEPINYEPKQPKQPEQPSTRLERIEVKLDKLISMWS